MTSKNLFFNSTGIEGTQNENSAFIHQAFASGYIRLTLVTLVKVEVSFKGKGTPHDENCWRKRNIPCKAWLISTNKNFTNATCWLLFGGSQKGSIIQVPDKHPNIVCKVGSEVSIVAPKLSQEIRLYTTTLSISCFCWEAIFGRVVFCEGWASTTFFIQENPAPQNSRALKCRKVLEEDLLSGKSFCSYSMQNLWRLFTPPENTTWSPVCQRHARLPQSLRCNYLQRLPGESHTNHGSVIIVCRNQHDYIGQRSAHWWFSHPSITEICSPPLPWMAKKHRKRISSSKF